MKIKIKMWGGFVIHHLSPEIIKLPFGRDTPASFLGDGKSATCCHLVPPSFLRISVEDNLPLPLLLPSIPPVTM